MPTRATQEAMAKSTYIPPQIQHAMETQMRQSLPPHLQQYVGPNRPQYIPRSIESQLSRQMQKTMPAHLRQYADAYVQQKVIEPSYATPVHAPGTTVTPHPPAPDLLRRSHSMPFGEQHSVDMNISPNEPRPSASGAPVQSSTSPAFPEDEAPKPPSYDFIFDPAKPNQGSRLPSLPGMSAGISKLVFVFVAAILLIFIISLAKNALSGPSNFPYLLAVAQDQQELVHIASSAVQQQGISSTNLNYASTVNLAMTSSSNQLLHYLAINGHNVTKSKQLFLKISATTDTNLSNSQLAGTYNQEFAQVNTSLLQGYMNDIKTAYSHTKGAHGQALLVSDYNQAQLLLTQVNSSIGSS